MNGIKIHLEATEQEAVRCHAEALGVDCEDIAYAALNRMMLELKTHEQEIDRDIVNTREWRHHYPPLWTDPAHSAHFPVSKGEGEAATSRWF